MPFWHRQEHEERTQASALAQETDPGRVAYFLLFKPYCPLPQEAAGEEPRGCCHTQHLPGPWPPLKLNQK